MKNLIGLAAGTLIALAAAAPAPASLSVTAELQRPFTAYNSTGVTTYNAATRRFQMTATLLATRFDGVAILIPLGSATIGVNLQVSNSGNLISGVSGIPDLIMTGSVDVDGDGTPEYTGTLLTAEVQSFGWQEAGATDLFDGRFRVTGGTMAGLYGNKIGLTITAEHSSFTGNFCVDFNAGAKGNIGNIDGDNVCPRSPGYWKNHECNWPLNTLTVGGVAYNHQQLANLLNGKLPSGARANGDAGARLAKFVITAKFDLLNGADDPDHIVELLSLADAFLAGNPIGSNLSDEDADYANDLADTLCDFVNSHPCNCTSNNTPDCHDDDNEDCGHHGSGHHGGHHSWGGWGSWSHGRCGH